MEIFSHADHDSMTASYATDFIVDGSLFIVYLSEHELNEEEIIVSTFAKPCKFL